MPSSVWGPPVNKGRECGSVSLIASLVLPETRVDELTDLVHCLFGPLAGGLDVETGALRSAQQEDAHHALGVRGLAGAADHDLARKASGELHQLGGGTRVEAKLVLHLECPPHGAHPWLPPSNRGA